MAQRYESGEGWVIVADALAPEGGNEYTLVHPDRPAYVFLLSVEDGVEGEDGGEVWSLLVLTEGPQRAEAERVLIGYLTEVWDCNMVIPDDLYSDLTRVGLVN